MVKKLSAVILILLFISFSFSCRNHQQAVPINSEKVSAFTGGIISPTESIRVVFNDAYDTARPIPAGMFQLKPAAHGRVFWENEWTLVFAPSKPLRPETRYRAIVDISKISEKENPPFYFEFQTQIPLLEIDLNSIRVDELGMAFISGIVTADKGMPIAQIERVLSSRELGRVEWDHQNGIHHFSFNPIARRDRIQTAAIRWDARHIGLRERGRIPVQIPKSNLFEVMDIRQIGRATLEIAFSSPLRNNQDLRGFVSLSGQSDIRYSIDGNIARIYGSDFFPGGTELIIKDLADIHGNRLTTPVSYRVTERWELPEVRYARTGNILPTTQGSVMVVETRNLSGIMVEAFEIRGDNMLQFLQINSLSGTRELNRVGAPVWSKTFDLPWQATDKNRWISHGLDISELATKYPDSLFRMRVTFRRHHVNFECTNTHPSFANLQFPDEKFPRIDSDDTYGDFSFWSAWGNNVNIPWEWHRFRRDPCHPAFYMQFSDHNITIGRNILVSDLGLAAKRSASGNWLVTAKDIRTATPVQNAEILFLNFQGRVLETLRTDRDGLVMSRLSSEPTFIFARGVSSRAFLRLSDSLALATSHFDISGDRPVSGIKGMIYGERGVWRPGDNIYLTFILSDPQNTLPANHPVLFELEDPRGRIVENRTLTSSVNGFYAITTSTRENAPTGRWTARVRVGGALFEQSLSVETVMPNRLKIDLVSGSDKPYLDTSPTLMTLESAWLHGATAPNLKADVSVVFTDRETSFATFQDYTFRDPSRVVFSERQTLFDGTLDQNGKAEFNVTLSPGTAVPGKLFARFLTRVFEPSGLFSTEQVTMEFSPYNRYVGIKLPKGDEARNMLLTDTDHAAEVVLLDSDGNLVQEDVRLEFSLHQLQWRWWWEKGAEEAASFSNALSRTPIMRGEVIARGGKATWNFRVNHPSWGRYLVLVRDVSGGHAAAEVAYIDWPGWAGRAQDGQQGAAAMLALTTEQPSYRPGETISISFPSNREARALVVVEKGGEIIRTEWIECRDTVTTYEFRADASMSPNIYVHITLFQQHLQTLNDLPIRLYGIIPVIIDDPQTHIRPQIIAPESWEPSTRASFTIREETGRAMTYTAVVVDEGLLGLTRFRMQNPRNIFYRREASFLTSWDLYAEIIGAFSGKLQTLLAIGGGDSGIDASARRTERFRPVVFYFGPYELAAGESKTKTFDMPQYVGAVRIMVVAASSPTASPVAATAATQQNRQQSGRAFGVAEHTVPVKSDLMVLGTVPRTLSPYDEIVIPVTVFSYREGRRSVRVDINIEGNLALMPDTPASINADFNEPGDTIVFFRAIASSLPGPAKINISASSRGLRDAGHEIELDIRSTAIPVTQALTELLPPNSVWERNIALPGRGDTNNAALELSRMPPIALESRLRFLILYPHGCLEQITSILFPQLYLDKVQTLTDDEKNMVTRNITAGIERLAGFQTHNGGFVYWPGAGDAHDWATSYAGHFLVEARRMGYEVPEALIGNWINFQRRRAADWAGRDDQELLLQAYRLYTISLAGAADIGSMNRLMERGNLPPAAAWRLAAAYWYAGQRETARTIARRTPITVAEYRELSGTFGSTFRDRAMILETMGLLGDDGRAKELLEEIAYVLSSDRWLSTQETAYALIAVMPFLQNRDNAELITIEATMQGQTHTIVFRSPIMRLDFGDVSGTEARTVLRNLSSLPVYARLVTKGLPAEGSEPALSQGLSLEVQYLDMEGREIDPFRLPLGDDMDIRVTVRNTSAFAVPEIALVHIIPAAWEIINTRIGAERGQASLDYNYQDIRDDRIMTYFDLASGRDITIGFRVNRTYAGNYFLPAIHAYAMYNESIRALIPGRRWASE
ncbi:MAG: MG2 domain-containing protein [Spirochaetaceae bacterium]|nr:MG2 domain-containing protein [Spirochaetaceae bacterium]